MLFELPNLPYAFNALEPVVDTLTMQIHHGKHHAAYVNNLNKALEGKADQADKTLEALVTDLASVPEAIRTTVRNNGGGHWNHSLFWQIMTPKGQSAAEPTGPLAQAIGAEFGSFAKFKEVFANAGATRFGSGWAWLGVKPDGKLCVCSTPNQDNPLMKGVVDCLCTPVLALDVWEHAYYLKYQNRRPDYISAWWEVVNWTKVSENFTKARSGK